MQANAKCLPCKKMGEIYPVHQAPLKCKLDGTRSVTRGLFYVARLKMQITA